MPLNALTPLTELNRYIALANNTENLVNPEVFYTKQLLDTIRIDASNYVYHSIADEQPLQNKANKLVIRRWSPLHAHTTPLVEGVPPVSDKGAVTKYEMEAHQYGRYMEFTDKVDFKVVDPVVAHYSREYSIVAIETLDLLAREELLAKAQKFFPNGKTSESELTLEDKPSLNDLRMIVLSLKRQLVKPRANGAYTVIVSPEFVFDMLDDELVQKYMTINQSTGKMFDSLGADALPKMFGMEFVESLVVPEGTLAGDMVMYRPYDSSLDSLISSNAKVTREGDNVYYAHEAGDDISAIPSEFAVDAPSLGAEVTRNLSTGETLKGNYFNNPQFNGQPTDFFPESSQHYLLALAGGLTPVDPEVRVMKYQHILIVGKEALTRTGLAGEGQAKMYTKPLGSAGVLDPIDQRQSIGFKINSVGYGTTRLEAVVDYVCVPTQL